MTTTTGPELLAVADRRARDLIASETPITLAEWEAFDDTLYRLLHTIVGPGRQLSGSDPGITRAVLTTFQTYPQPIRPARGETYSPVEAARLLGVPRNRITKRLRDGDLSPHVVKREWRIDAAQLDTRPDVIPAAADDSNPLARLSVALGGLADLLTPVTRDEALGRLTDDRHIAAAMRHVLAIASVAARHAITRLPIADADRPLRIAQYAERAVDTLAGPDAYPQLWQVASVHPRPTTDTLDERLEAALEEWALAARDDLRHRIPSSDVVRNIMTTGVHLLATTDATLQHVGRQRRAQQATIVALREQIRTTGLALHAAAAVWEPVTTAMTPSLRYGAAARDAFSVLAATQATLTSRTPDAQVDLDQALRKLLFATRPLFERMVTIDALSAQLLDSQLLFVRARAIRPRAAIIHDRAKGHLVVARAQDVPKLVDATREARQRIADLSARMRDLGPSLVGLLDADHTIAANGPKPSKRITGDLGWRMGFYNAQDGCWPG